VINEEKSDMILSFAGIDREYGEKTKKLEEIFDVHYLERKIARITQSEDICFPRIQILPDPELQKEVDVLIYVDPVYYDGYYDSMVLMER